MTINNKILERLRLTRSAMKRRKEISKAADVMQRAFKLRFNWLVDVCKITVGHKGTETIKLKKKCRALTNNIKNTKDTTANIKQQRETYKEKAYIRWWMIYVADHDHDDADF